MTNDSAATPTPPHSRIVDLGHFADGECDFPDQPVYPPAKGTPPMHTPVTGSEEVRAVSLSELVSHTTRPAPYDPDCVLEIGDEPRPMTPRRQKAIGYGWLLGVTESGEVVYCDPGEWFLALWALSPTLTLIGAAQETFAFLTDPPPWWNPRLYSFLPERTVTASVTSIDRHALELREADRPGWFVLRTDASSPGLRFCVTEFTGRRYRYCDAVRPAPH